MVKAEIDPDTRLGTYRKCPPGSAATEYGSVPTGFGDPLISVNWPLLDEMEYDETLPALELATYKKPLEDAVRASGFAPVGKGEPVIGVNATVVSLME